MPYNSNQKMPKVDLAKITDLSDDEQVILNLVINKQTGRLKATSPGKAFGDAHYVWRMVAFMVSPKPQHQCMPYGADFYLKVKSFNERAARCNQLKTLEDKIINAVDKKQWHGIKRWGGALGFTE